MIAVSRSSKLPKLVRYRRTGVMIRTSGLQKHLESYAAFQLRDKSLYD